MRDYVEKAKRGDLEAFAALVDRYKDMVYGTAYAILGNFHDAQDASQDAFILAWRKIKTLNDSGHFPAWLCRIAKNRSLDRLRRCHTPTGSIDDVAEVLPDRAHKNPGQCAEHAELHETVLEAIRSLPEPQRLATALFYINGYSIDEVADFLEAPAGTVKRRLHDARIQLRERMAGMVEDAFKSNSLPRDFSRDTLRKIGDFACLEMIGYGGMGSVYLAEHPVLKHKVAIGIAADRRPELREIFETGRIGMAKLNHPGFVKVFSYGEHEGRPYTVFEFLNGLPLRGWLNDREPRNLFKRLCLLLQMARAIAHAHEREVIVGSLCISPVHVMVLLNDTPVFTSAGIPQAAFRRAAQAIGNSTGDTWSSHLAPECANGGQPSELSDIWGLGVLMHEIILGKPLFDGKSGDEIVRELESPGPLDVNWRNDCVPDCVASVLKTCLEKDPRNRFSSAAELAAALEDAQFAGLVRLKDYDMQRLLLDVETETLAIALHGSSQELTARMLDNMNHKAAGLLRLQWAKTPPSPGEIHSARCAVVTIAQRLLQECRIEFS